jgi:flagellar biosynthesis/type III secretory pathway protein FliH
MPSSTDSTLATGPAGRPAVTVRLASFDRQLTGAAAVGTGPGWGDPRIDAALAEAFEAARAQGRAEGWAAGWTAGHRAGAERGAVDAVELARAAHQQQLAQAARAEALLDAVAVSARATAAATAPTWDDLAAVLADGALALARAALGRELASVDDDLVLRVHAALRLVAGDGRVVLRLAPGDLPLFEGVTLPEGTVLLADAGVAPGTVAVRTDTQRLLLDVPAAVAAAEEVLRA